MIRSRIAARLAVGTGAAGLAVLALASPAAAASLSGREEGALVDLLSGVSGFLQWVLQVVI